MTHTPLSMPPEPAPTTGPGVRLTHSQSESGERDAGSVNGAQRGAQRFETPGRHHTADTITDDQLDALYREIETLRHIAAGNKAHAHYAAAELAEANATLARARTALPSPDAPDPTTTSEVLPPHLLAAIDTPPYLSTACDTAARCQHAAAASWSDDLALDLADEALALHEQCRRIHKFTAAPCTCPCHGHAEPEGN